MLLVRRVCSEQLLDSSGWLVLYRELAASRPTPSLGGPRTLYEAGLRVSAQRGGSSVSSRRAAVNRRPEDRVLLSL